MLRVLALAAGSTAFALLAAELVLRGVVGPPVHWKAPQERYVADPELGFRLAPDQRAFTHDAPVRTNALGLRDDELAPRPAEGVRRILALGDSQTFGNGLRREETWPAQLEQALEAAHGDGRFEVVNAGIPATDSWQHARLLARLAEGYVFHLALLAVYPNDVRRPPGGGPEALASALRGEDAGLRRLGQRLRRSALVTALWQARQPLRVLLDPSAGGGAAREARIVRGESGGELAADWAALERALASAAAAARGAGARLCAVVIPRRDQVAAARPARGFNRRVAALAARSRVPVVDPLDDLRKAYGEHGDALFIPWDGHHAAPANGAIARRLAAELTAQTHPEGSARSASGCALPARSALDGHPH